MVDRQDRDPLLGEQLEGFQALGAVGGQAQEGGVAAAVGEAEERFGEVELVQVQLDAPGPGFEGADQQRGQLRRGVGEEPDPQDRAGAVGELVGSGAAGRRRRRAGGPSRSTTSPAAVGSTPRWLRTSRVAPSSFSSRPICTLSAGWEMCSRSAALPTNPASTTTRQRSAGPGGRGRRS